MVMVTEGLTLIGMKTANTPPRSKSVDERIDQIRERCMRTELFSLRHLLLWRFTQEVCKEMHIALYKIEHSDNDGIARQVELTRNPSLASGLSTLLRWLSK